MSQRVVLFFTSILMSFSLSARATSFGSSDQQFENAENTKKALYQLSQISRPQFEQMLKDATQQANSQGDTERASLS